MNRRDLWLAMIHTKPQIPVFCITRIMAKSPDSNRRNLYQIGWLAGIVGVYPDFLMICAKIAAIHQRAEYSQHYKEHKLLSESS